MLVLLFALVIITPLSHATQQGPDRVTVNGVDKWSYSTPLNEAAKHAPELWKRLLVQLPERSCSANWRGYNANWEIVADELRLVSISRGGCDADSGKAIPLSSLRPGAAGPIAATWFTGEMFFEREPRVEGPCGFSPTCPSGYDVFIFKNGKKIGETFRPLQR